MADEIEDPAPVEVADYIADTAGFTQTAALLFRAELSALADLRSRTAKPIADDNAA